MRSAVLALVLSILPQEESAIAEWIRRLEDDAVAVRDKAFAALVQAGPAAEPALRTAAASGSAEVRERAADALRAIGWKQRYDPGPSLVTLRREKAPLKEVLGELRKQVSTKIADFEGEDAPVSVNLEKVPLFRALEAICRSHGKIDYDAQCGWGEDPEVSFDERPFAKCPRVVDGAVELRLKSIVSELRLTPGAAPTEGTTFAFEWSWEKGTRPLAGRLEIEELKDDAGNSYADRLESREERISSTHIDTDLERKMACVPPGKVTRFSVIKGALVVVLPLSVEEFSFADPASEVGKSRESRWGSVKLAEFEPVTAVFHATVETRPEALVDRLTVALMDAEGKPFNGRCTVIGHMQEHGEVGMDYTKDGDRKAAVLRCTAEVGRRERRIPFEFKDVRFR